MFCKIEVLNNSTKFAGKKTVPESLLNKVAGLHACNFNRKRLQHIFFGKFCETFKNSLSTRTPLVKCFYFLVIEKAIFIVKIYKNILLYFIFTAFFSLFFMLFFDVKFFHDFEIKNCDFKVTLSHPFTA